MQRFFAATGRFAVRFRWAIVTIWVAAAVTRIREEAGPSRCGRR